MQNSPSLGKIVILAGPSGSGKTTCVKALLSNPSFPFQYGVSYTTRQPRPGEIPGQSYHFVTREEFMADVESGEFLEWEEVYSGICYGTKEEEVEKVRKEGKHYLTELDIKGAINIKMKYRTQALIVFLTPPSIEALEERLKERGDVGDTLKERLHKSLREWRWAKGEEENGIILLPNYDLSTTIEELTKLVTNFLTPNETK